jgi:PPE-repeat protein
MNFSVLPPEINSLLMFAGAGSAPMLEAAAAWEGLADELGSAASSFGSVTSGLVGQAWQGPASAAMAAAAALYASFLSAAAAQAAGAAGQARTVASVFEAAQAATIQPIAVIANRNALVQMVLSNWFGLNAPVIAQIEGEYEAMWAQDVTAMAGYYGGASAAAAQLTPWAQAAQALPAAALSPINNIGTGNLGFGNIGNANAGSGNTGNAKPGQRKPRQPQPGQWEQVRQPQLRQRKFGLLQLGQRKHREYQRGRWEPW